MFEAVLAQRERKRGKETWASFASNTKPSFSSFSLRLDSSLPDLYSTCGDRCVGVRIYRDDAV